MTQPRDKRAPGNSRIQGEGDYVSGRRYQKDVEEFARTHDTEKLAREAQPKSEAERLEMLEAERKGKARAKGKKPAKGKARAIGKKPAKGKKPARR